jgi:hypothetical protein
MVATRLGITSLFLFALLIGPSNVVAQSSPDAPTLTLASTLGTAFTYQGQLASGSAPVSGSCDFFMNGEQAVEYGLADEVLGPQRVAVPAGR